MLLSENAGDETQRCDWGWGRREGASDPVLSPSFVLL
jgi:hypothetical protein